MQQCAVRVTESGPIFECDRIRKEKLSNVPSPATREGENAGTMQLNHAVAHDGRGFVDFACRLSEMSVIDSGLRFMVSLPSCIFL
jgi:hypothetical protein